MSNEPSLFAELKRRNVYKVAVAYAVVSWLLIQIATQVFPFFEIPNWAVRLVVLVLILGFPVALILSWAFEITPEGIKRESEVSPNESITAHTGRKLIGITIALAVIAAGLLAFQLLRTKPTPAPRQSEAAIATPDGQGLAGARPSIPEKSIAVLPFDNLSRDPDNAYFAEGIQDEVLTRLAKVADLKVISRTSTQHFKSSPDNLPEIARQLGVANILEGSVQRSADQVRVNVQLIKAATDGHLWADIYDRKLTDIFAVESEIAKSIAEKLQAQLTGSEKAAIASRPTENPDAYQLYLKGRFFWSKRTGEDLKTAADLFQRAVAADPSYASAYGGLAQSYLLIPVFGAGAPQDFFPKAKVAATRAIALDDTSAEGHSALAMLLLFELKLPESEREFRRAIEINPNYATAHHWFGNSLLVTLGRFDEAVKEGQRAVELDPLSLIINADLGSTLMVGRRYDAAIAQLQRTLSLDANFAYAHWNMGEALYLKGDVQGAIAQYEKAAALDDDPEIMALLARAYAETGRKEEALRILNKLKETGRHQYVRSYLFALIYIGLGDKAIAIDYLEQARQGQETPDTTWLKVDPLFDPLRDEPGFKQLVAKMFPGGAP
jgi:TolB-like protein/Tfp pilus assembly protein PilF